MITGPLLASADGLPLAAAALQYAKHGVPVFPCLPGGKKPLTGHGFLDASTDPLAVRRWWVRWPHANIGLPTGAASGADVIDIDVHAAPGPQSYDRADAAGLVNGWLAQVQTPSGGMHAYHPTRPGCRQPSWQAAAAGIDFRGTGGYIVAPPSRLQMGNDQIAYQVIAVTANWSQPVDAAALRRFLDPRPTRPAPSDGVRRPGSDADRLASWVASRREGERNRGLFWAACRLAEDGQDASTTLAVLGPAAEHAGLPATEITTTIRSAYRTASTSLRSLPDQEPGRPTARAKIEGPTL